MQGETAAACDRAAEREVIAAFDHQVGVVSDGTGEDAGAGAAVAQLQSAGVDEGWAAVVEWARQDLCASAQQGDLALARTVFFDGAAEGAAACAVEAARSEVVGADAQARIGIAGETDLHSAATCQRVHTHGRLHGSEDCACGHIQARQVVGPDFVGVAAADERALAHVNERTSAHGKRGWALPIDCPCAGLAEGARTGEQDRAVVLIEVAAGVGTHIEIERGARCDGKRGRGIAIGGGGPCTGCGQGRRAQRQGPAIDCGRAGVGVVVAECERS